MPQFESARLKIERACRHVALLETAIAELETRNRRDIEPDPQGCGETIVHEIPGRDGIMKEVALVAGDAIHNFRASLDHAWVGALEVSSLGATDHTSFPVRKHADSLEKALKEAGVQPESRLFELLVSDIRSYKGGNELLWALHQLDITDKHRLLLTAIEYASVDGIEIVDLGGNERRGGTWGGHYSDPIRIWIPKPDRVINPGQRRFWVLLQHHTISGIEIGELLMLFRTLTLDVVQRLESVS